MEIADDLRDGALDPEKFFREEIEHLQRLILEKPLGARIVGVGQRMKTYRDNQVIDPRVRELGHDRVGFHDLEIFEQSAAPLLRLACSAVFLDHSLEVIEIRHRLSPSGSGYRIFGQEYCLGERVPVGPYYFWSPSESEYIGAGDLQQAR